MILSHEIVSGRKSCIGSGNESEELGTESEETSRQRCDACALQNLTQFLLTTCSRDINNFLFDTFAPRVRAVDPHCWFVIGNKTLGNKASTRTLEHASIFTMCCVWPRARWPLSHMIDEIHNAKLSSQCIFKFPINHQTHTARWNPQWIIKLVVDHHTHSESMSYKCKSTPVESSSS